MLYVSLLTLTCKIDPAFRVNGHFVFQELTAAEEEQVEEDKEKQLQVSLWALGPNHLVLSV